MGGVRKRGPVCASASAVLFGHVVSHPKKSIYFSSNESHSDYAAKVFGFANFGRVYGTIVCFSGLINLSQPLIDAANHEVFHDNPIPINIVLTSLGAVIGIALTAFVWIQDHKIHKQEEKTGGLANERTRLLPEIDEEE